MGAGRYALSEDEDHRRDRFQDPLTAWSRICRPATCQTDSHGIMDAWNFCLARPLFKDMDFQTKLQCIRASTCDLTVRMILNQTRMMNSVQPASE